MKYVQTLVLILVFLTGLNLPLHAQQNNDDAIPVIYDTDIGDDIDDLWGLVFAVKSPELDVKLVTTSRRPTVKRAKVAAKMLTIMGRDDIPIAAGRQKSNPTMRYYSWAKDFSLSEYSGEFSVDGVEKMIETVRSVEGVEKKESYTRPSAEKMRKAVRDDEHERLRIISTGTMTNVAAMLHHAPELAGAVEFLAMSGEVKTKSRKDPGSETNVKLDISAAKKGYPAPWRQFTIAPINITGDTHLTGHLYRHVYESDRPSARALMEAYKIFKPRAGWVEQDVTKASSTLHDPVAVYLAFSDQFVNIKTLPLRVNDDGITKINREEGRPVRVALSWKDRKAFLKLLVRRITGSLPSD